MGGGGVFPCCELTLRFRSGESVTNWGAIIGGSVFGLLALVAIVAAVVYVSLKKRKSRRYAAQTCSSYNRPVTIVQLQSSSYNRPIRRVPVRRGSSATRDIGTRRPINVKHNDFKAVPPIMI